MFKIQFYYCLIILFTLFSCTRQKEDSGNTTQTKKTQIKPSVIIDCQYTFEQAIKGSNAPAEIIHQLKLIDVRYYSTDNKIHQGQILTNIKIAGKIALIFRHMLHVKFPVAHAIPIVKYNWNDDLSMKENNSSSFCYRDTGFSKHASGMAIDINPYFNPVRWKKEYENHVNKPIGAHFDPATPGTFYKLHPVVQEFQKLGFFWGHNFTLKYDDHHFEI